MYESQFLPVPQRFERSQRRMKSEEAIKIDGGIGRNGGIWPRDRNRGAKVVITLLTMRDNDIETIGRAALKDGDEYFIPSTGRVFCERRSL